MIIEGIFGPGTCTLDPSSNDTNDVIDALSATSGFGTFQANFMMRLRRLKEAYDGHPSMPALLIQVNQVGDRNNWQGAVAELAAIDFFVSDRNWLPNSPQLDVNIDVSDSLASKFGMKVANLDVHFEHFDVYSDVKVLKDNVTEILEGIYGDIWPGTRPLIKPEYPKDTSSDDVKAKRPYLLDLLRREIDDGKQPIFIDCSSVVDGLKIRLRWTGGVLAAESSYSPYKYANEFHRLPLQHAKKFVISRPFFLTFVIFPWFNSIVTDFCDDNKTFYRSLARRVFCQYKHDASLFSSMFRKYSGAETIYEVSQELGAILFLEDKSINGENLDATNVIGYYYENPNGHRAPSNGTMGDYLRGCIRGDYDDFKHDNY